MTPFSKPLSSWRFGREREDKKNTTAPNGSQAAQDKNSSNSGMVPPAVPEPVAYTTESSDHNRTDLMRLEWDNIDFMLRKQNRYPLFLLTVNATSSRSEYVPYVLTDFREQTLEGNTKKIYSGKAYMYVTTNLKAWKLPMVIENVDLCNPHLISGPKSAVKMSRRILIGSLSPSMLEGTANGKFSKFEIKLAQAIRPWGLAKNPIVAYYDNETKDYVAQKKIGTSKNVRLEYFRRCNFSPSSVTVTVTSNTLQVIKKLIPHLGKNNIKLIRNVS
ncbi:hypothetical protein N7462_001551 [Penicillium macrosclerotiorum]|uniref:uncharacterized protein n=1 Tax=Penicillium macrosclerotiorum TaxID=303699 RepID=UPI002546F07F|nr:uncharacterized protein N7462_001551 [Penicillium macrosclerotiorum]KAJ5692128.1 hypothetical protein N7462_001551 [Penicillium macrosclerotiorum]